MIPRLTNRHINELSHLLEGSSPIASAASADLQDDIILLEHQAALYGDEQAPSAQSTESAESQPSNLPMPRLVHAINVSITPQTFDLVFRDGKNPLIRLSLSWLEVYRVVKALSQNVHAAVWNLSVDAAWLEPGQTEIVFN